MNEEQVKKTCDGTVTGFRSLACVCGLSFPESAKEFQMAILTLSHLMAALRESVLKGSDIPESVLNQMWDLCQVAMNNKDEQK